MNRNQLKKLAYKQQLDHLAHAQTQAMKILIEQQQPYKLSVEGALQYFEAVKTKLGPQLFPEFRQIMRECREPNADCMVTVSKICHLFQDYPELLQGFGMFLPPNINLQVQTASRFIVKAEKNELFSLIVKDESPEKDESPDWLQKAESSTVESDSTMDDLQDDSEKASTVSREIDPHFAVQFINKVKERFQNAPEIFSKFLELLDTVRRDCMSEQVDIETDVYMEICELFQNNDDLIEEFKTFVPNATVSEQYESLEEPQVESELNFQNEESVTFSEPPIETPKWSEVNDPSIASVGKYGSYEEHLFFDKVRKALCHKEVYENFLRCLMLFTEDVVTRSELLKVATSFLGKFPSLLKQFKDMLGFNESGQNIETIPMKIIHYESYRSDPEVALDIDYSTGGRNGASYRALPKDMKQPICSGRTALCKEVLNDIWVSFPSWSEDSTFVTSCKTEYEEMIYRCEDERFELDMAIEANSYTIFALENVQKKINKMTPEEKSMFSLDDTLGGTSTVLHQKALHRCYGDKTDELVEGLKRNPVVAVPIILKRLRGKEEEWKEKQKQFNNTWREQIDNYYLKSLDHQGINFKQNDSKSFRSKSLLHEMEMVHAEKKENTVTHFSFPHFCLEFKDICVFHDASNLVCQYLKKLPGVFRDDRKRIELLVKNFIPDFFGFPRAFVSEEETPEEEEEDEQAPLGMEIDNENEERSGHTSPVGSTIMPKDEDFSDPEESNSVEENENDSEESDKNSFIEDSDIFDKLDTLHPTNLPYTLFFVSKHWYVFFRQFHILCERLSRLLHESNRKDLPPITIKSEDGVGEEQIVDCKPTYTELVSKLSQLLSGTIDYAQFEDEARSLFGIHAFVTFTMDKLILNIVRQLQQIVGDDQCKQCTAFFYRHNKVIAAANFSSPVECEFIENQYLKKVERIMNEDKCFKVLWHKKDHTLTIELIEHVIEKIDDAYEVEKWSDYLDQFVTEESNEEAVEPAAYLPVFLPRNLRQQKEFWKRKVAHVENLWNKRHSPSFIKKNPPKFLCKRKADFQTYFRPAKTHSPLKSTVDESVSEISTTVEIVADSTQPEFVKTEPEPFTSQPESVTIQHDDSASTIMEDSIKIDSVNTTVQSNLQILQTPTDMEIVQESIEINVSEHLVTESQKFDTTTQNKTNNVAFFCTTAETPEEENILQDIVKMEEKNLSTQKIIEDNECVKLTFEKDNIDTVAAFHDITEESLDNEIIVETEVEPESIEIITVMDSGEEGNAEEGKSDSDSGSLDKDENSENVHPKKKSQIPKKKLKSSPKAEEAASKSYKSKPPQPRYTKRRTKRTLPKIRRKRKNIEKQEDIDFITRDYEYFSELSAEDKCWYLAMKDLVVHDDTEGAFLRENMKLLFVQNCDFYLYRRNSISRASEIHQRICEIKTSNFNAWHRIWLDRYVTPTMSKFCSDWFLRSDPEKFKVLCITMSDCSKPPYIPYSKYKVRYYKTDA